MSRGLEKRVRERAKGRCEYGKIPDSSSVIPFQLDHIIAQKHRGADSDENRAYSCPNCNYHKGKNISGIGTEAGKHAKLFHPRRNRWSAHFDRDGATLVGKTAVGRTTIAVLNINDPDQVKLRQLLIDADEF